MELVVLKVSER